MAAPVNYDNAKSNWKVWTHENKEGYIEGLLNDYNRVGEGIALLNEANAHGRLDWALEGPDGQPRDDLDWYYLDTLQGIFNSDNVSKQNYETYYTLLEKLLKGSKIPQRLSPIDDSVGCKSDGGRRRYRRRHQKSKRRKRKVRSKRKSRSRSHSGGKKKLRRKLRRKRKSKRRSSRRSRY